MEPKEGERYKHFKGKQYRVISTVHHSENWEQKLVIYQPIDDPEDASTGSLEMWAAEIEKPEYNKIALV